MLTLGKENSCQRETQNSTPVEICSLVYFTEMFFLGCLSVEIVKIKIISVIDVFRPLLEIVAP